MNNEPDYKDNLAFEPEMTKINDGIIHDLNLLIKNIRELIEQQKLKDDGFLQHCIKSIEWNRDKLKEQNDEFGVQNDR